jgi:hypothetical protein
MFRQKDHHIYLVLKQVRKIKGFIFRHQAFDIQRFEIGGRLFAKAKLLKIQDAVKRMALVTGHADFLLGDVPVKIIQAFGSLLVRQVFFFLKELFCLARILGIECQ